MHIDVRVFVNASSYLCLVLGLLWERRLFGGTHRQLKPGAAEEWLMVKSTWLEVATMFTQRLRPSHRNQMKKEYILHKFTRFPFCTEAHQVVHTDHPSCVSVSAVRT